MAVNPVLKSWTPRFNILKSVDGGNALKSVISAYDLTPGITGVEVLRELINVGRMDRDNQLDKAYEAFSLHGAALLAAFPRGDDLLDIVLNSIGEDPSPDLVWAFNKVDKFCI